MGLLGSDRRKRVESGAAGFATMLDRRRPGTCGDELEVEWDGG